MDIVVLLFGGITALDAVGPYEVLSRLPEATVRFVAAEPGPQRTDNASLALIADFGLDDVDHADVLVVPGGFGVAPLLTDEVLLSWVRRINVTTRWTTSVCTGALVLGAAGLLNGLPATTHWNSMDKLPSYGAIPRDKRVVEAGKVVTAAGVSAGIDMALLLAGRIAGDTTAQAIQLSIEYDPQPPFTAGSPRTAPPEIVELVRSRARARR